MAIGESRSAPTTLQYGVPQGSVLGVVLFTVYTGTLAFFLEAHGVSYHFFFKMTHSCTSGLKIVKRFRLLPGVKTLFRDSEEAYPWCL